MDNGYFTSLVWRLWTQEVCAEGLTRLAFLLDQAQELFQVVQLERGYLLSFLMVPLYHAIKLKHST